MMEDPDIIQMNIDRYQDMLTLDLDHKTRARVTQLLGEANRQLVLANDLKRS